MSSARHQLILLGFICQGLAWDDLWLPLGNILLWWLCLARWRGRIHLSVFTEGMVLIGGCAAALWGGRMWGANTQFFLGHGLTLLQAARLLRPLNRREQLLSVVMACMQVAVGCTFLFDLRFLPVLGAMVFLVPATLKELEAESFPVPATRRRERLGWGAYMLIAAVMVLFFVAFPRGSWRSPVAGFRGAVSGSGTLLDSVLDPARSASAQSRRVVLQIQGENIGYLRCYALTEFDGQRWSVSRREGLRWMGAPTSNALAQGLHRRVLVKDVAMLDRVLPADGFVVRVEGRFFRRPMRNSQDAIQCESMWNAANNFYEYWTAPEPRPDPLSAWQAEALKQHPPSSARLQQWLEAVLAGVTNPVTQAQRLESHLRQNFTYRLGAPELNRLNAVDDFVFNAKQGHCERFAATLALLLRMKGIPSRVVIGYLPSQQSWMSGWHTVRFSNAHAWTEAYFEKIGWLQLDATPAAATFAPGESWRDLWDTLDLAWTLNVVNYNGNSQQQLLNLSLNWVGGIAGVIQRHVRALLGIMAGLLVLVGGRFWWRSRDSVAVARHAPSATAAFAGHYYGKMLQVLSRHGYQRRPAQTPLEFLQELQQKPRPWIEEVRCVTEAFCATRYGDERLTVERQKAIQEALERICAPAEDGR